MGNGTGQRALVIGIEGVCNSILEPLVDADVVPNLAGVLDAGVVEPLATDAGASPARTAASIATGVGPSTHGVLGSSRRDGQPVDATSLRERPLWALLDDHGLASVLVDVPASHPAAPITGAVLADGPSEPPACHPAGLFDELTTAIGEYRMTPPTASTRDEQVAGFCELARMRGRAFRHLVGRFDPAFGYLHFDQPAAVAEALPGDEAALRAVYGAVDEEIGQVLDDWTPEVVLVVSGYGVEATAGYEFRVNEFLREQGYLAATVDASTPPSPPETEGLLSRLLAGVRSVVGSSEAHPTDRVGASSPPDFFVDRAASRAYACDPTGIYLNDEANAELLEALVSRLERVETPDGTPVFDRVVARGAASGGQAGDTTPDVGLVPAAGVRVSTALEGATFGPKRTVAVAERPGLLGVAGRIINAEADCSGATLEDVAPTVLSALDVPWSDRMEGVPLPVVEPTGEASYPLDGPATSDGVATQRLADPSSAE